MWRYAGGSPATLQWLRDDGRADAVVETPARYAGFDLVPNGRRLAFSRRNVDGGADGWVRDLRRSTETRLTFGQGDDAVDPAGKWRLVRDRVTPDAPVDRVALEDARLVVHQCCQLLGINSEQLAAGSVPDRRKRNSQADVLLITTATAVDQMPRPE